MARAAAAEAAGTFALVLTIVSTVIGADLARPAAGGPYGSLAVPPVGGVALAALVASLGPVSGAHLNPAVALGLAVNRRFPGLMCRLRCLLSSPGPWPPAAAVWARYGQRARDPS